MLNQLRNRPNPISRFVALLAVVAMSAAAGADVTFTDEDLQNGNQVVFTVTYEDLGKDGRLDKLTKSDRALIYRQLGKDSTNAIRFLHPANGLNFARWQLSFDFSKMSSFRPTSMVVMDRLEIVQNKDGAVSRIVSQWSTSATEKFTGINVVAEKRDNNDTVASVKETEVTGLAGADKVQYRVNYLNQRKKFDGDGQRHRWGAVHAKATGEDAVAFRIVFTNGSDSKTAETAE